MVAKALRRRGIIITPALQTSYLGADLGAGRRHAREQRSKRNIKHRDRNKKVIRYTRVLRRAQLTSRLERQGAQAAGSYGYQLYGVMGSHLAAYRRRLGAACSGKTKGRCLTTLLALEAPGMDPAERFAVGTFELWLQQWRDQSHLRDAVRRAWPKVRSKLEAVPAAARCRHIRGPMSAIITYMLGFGWVPSSPTSWEPPGDFKWDFPDANFTGVPALDNFTEFLTEVRSAAMAPFWKQAELHYDGEGLGKGIDGYSMRLLLKQLRGVRPGGPRLAGLLMNIAMGAAWPKARKYEQLKTPHGRIEGRNDVSNSSDRSRPAGNPSVFSSLCDRCGLEKETSFHRNWSCSQNKGAVAYEKSDVLVGEAWTQHEVHPCFWHRGLIPADWTRTPEPPHDHQWTSGGLSNGVFAGCLPMGSSTAPAVIFGDASGGPDTADCRLRRVALGIAMVTDYTNPTVRCFITGPLSGSRQVVARGELRGLWLAIWASQGPIIYVTDCEGVYKGWQARAYEHHRGADGDEWARIGQLLVDRSPELVQVRFVNSHLSGEDVVAGRAEAWMVVGNTIVDELVKEAAITARLPSHVRFEVLRVERRAYLVRHRLLRASLDVLTVEAEKGMKEKAGPPPPPPLQPPAPSIVATMGSQHLIDDTGLKCRRCFSSATLARATEWKRSPCFKPLNVNGDFHVLPPNQKLHLAGGWAHDSHRLKLCTNLNLWFCGVCGSFSSKRKSAIQEPCLGKAKATGEEYLRRIRSGQWPKVLSKAEKACRLATPRKPHSPL